MSPADEWISVAQLASELGVTEATIMDWIRAGKDIPHFEFRPGILRFRRSDVAPLIRERGIMTSVRAAGS